MLFSDAQRTASAAKKMRKTIWHSPLGPVVKYLPSRPPSSGSGAFLLHGAAAAFRISATPDNPPEPQRLTAAAVDPGATPRHRLTTTSSAAQSWAASFLVLPPSSAVRPVPRAGRRRGQRKTGRKGAQGVVRTAVRAPLGRDSGPAEPARPSRASSAPLGRAAGWTGDWVPRTIRRAGRAVSVALVARSGPASACRTPPP